MNQKPVRVAITGTLSRPRREIVEMIESMTNGRMCSGVTYETNYLVASRFDTVKAKAAARLGVRVINEAEMTDFVSKGAFPSSPLPVRPPSQWHPVDLDGIIYQTIEQFEPARVVYLKYRDHSGKVTERFITAINRVRYESHEYLGGMDSDQYKTFRLDRILAREDLGPVAKETPP